MSQMPPSSECSVQLDFDPTNPQHLRPVHYPWREIRGVMSAHSLFAFELSGKESSVSKVQAMNGKTVFYFPSIESNSPVELQMPAKIPNSQCFEPETNSLEPKLKCQLFTFLNSPNEKSLKRVKQSTDSEPIKIGPPGQLTPSQLTSRLPHLCKTTADSSQSIESPLPNLPISNHSFTNHQENLKALRQYIVNYFATDRTIEPKDPFANKWETDIFLELARFMGIITAEEYQYRDFNPRAISHRPMSKRKKKLKMFQMIYSKVIKGLQRVFDYQHSQSLVITSPLKCNTDFFEYYFRTIAEANREHISAYDHFKNTINSNLSYEFLKRVFRSEKLKADFLDYLDHHLANDYHAERIERINYLFDKWERLISNGGKDCARKLAAIKKEINSPNFKFVLDDWTLITYIEKFKDTIAEDFKLRARSQTGVSRPLRSSG